MHQFHYEEYRICNQSKTKKFCRFISSYSTVFTFNPIHWSFKYFLLKKNIFIFIVRPILATIFLFTPVAFYIHKNCLLEWSTFFSFESANSSMATSPISSFILPTTNGFQLQYFDLPEYYYNQIFLYSY